MVKEMLVSPEVTQESKKAYANVQKLDSEAATGSTDNQVICLLAKTL